MPRVRKRNDDLEEESLLPAETQLQLRTRGQSHQPHNHGLTVNNNQSVSSLSRYDFLTHEVLPNDTLAGIALRYNCKLPLLKQANNLSSEIQLAALPTLRVPVPRNSLQIGQLIDISAKVEIQREAAVHEDLCPQKYMTSVDERVREIQRSLPDTPADADPTFVRRPEKPHTWLTSTTLMVICLLSVCVGLPILYTVYILTNPLHGDVFHLLPS